MLTSSPARRIVIVVSSFFSDRLAEVSLRKLPPDKKTPHPTAVPLTRVGFKFQVSG